MNAQQRTIVRLWRDAVASGRPDPLYLAEGDGEWTPVPLAEAARRVDELANGLLALGIRKGDAFGILAGTRVEWCLFDFALALVGGVTAPIYANSSPEDCRYVLEPLRRRRRARRGRGAAARRSRRCAASCRRLRPRPDVRRPRRAGRPGAGSTRAEHPDALAQAEAEVGEDDLFTFIYTSGTTGPPKGCKILHRNYYEMAKVVHDMADVFQRDDLLLLYLPLAHNFGRLTHLLAPMAGYTIAFCADPYAVADALPKVRPTVFPSVPRLYEKMHTAVLARFDEATGARRRLIDWALDVGRRVSVLRQQGQPIPRGLAVQHRLADRLVYSKVKERLGGRLRRAVSGGAPLAVEILEFFHALDILILEAYGLTECTTGATSSREDSFKFGTVGKALPGWELKLAEDGELFIRSPTVFAGYYKDDEATAAILDDGRLARDRATSPRSTTRASSRSPTARRTSSSPRAARTSRRRTSRTS